MDTYQYTVHKIPLAKFVKKPITQSHIYETCKEINKLVIHVYQFLRLKLLYHFKLGTFPDLTETDVRLAFKVFLPKGPGRPFDDKQLLAEYTSFYDDIYQPLTNCQRFKITGISYIVDQLVTDIVTNIENNVKMNLKAHVSRFLNGLFNPTYDKTLKQELAIVRDDILAKNSVIKSPEQYHEIIAILGNIFPDSGEENHYLGCCKRPMKYLEPMFFMAEILQSRQQKTLQAFPLRRSLIPANIPLDTSTLITLFFKDRKPSKLLKQVRNEKESIWGRLFHMNHRVLNKNNKFVFDYRIFTDGHSVSIQLIDKKDAPKKESRKDRMCDGRQNKDVKTTSEPKATKVEAVKKRKMCNSDWKYIGDLNQGELERLRSEGFLVADPGKDNLLYLLDSISKETMKFTSREKREVTHENRFCRKIDRFRRVKGVLEVEKKLKEVSGKSCDIKGFEKYICVKEDVSKEVRGVYEAKIFRKLRWYTHVERLKYFNSVVKKIESSGKKTIVYGDWSAKGTLKGSRSTVGIGLKRRLSNNFEIINLDEYRTSKLDFKNHEECSNLKVGGKSVHSMLTYKLACGTGNIGRDLNAVRNMLYIVLEVMRTGVRPEAFRRGKIGEGLSGVIDVISESGPVHDVGVVDIVLD